MPLVRIIRGFIVQVIAIRVVVRVIRHLILFIIGYDANIWVQCCWGLSVNVSVSVSFSVGVIVVVVAFLSFFVKMSGCWWLGFVELF